MNAFSNIDMAEVTRLTRAGKLAEAMEMLQGRAAPRVSEPGALVSTRLIARRPAESKTASRSGADQPKPRAAATGWAAKMQALRENLPRLRAFGEGAAPVSVPVPQGARFEERTYANGSGSRSYKVYVPSSHKGQPLPVVVMLHGCTQNPDDFAAGTRMNEVAEEQGLLVVYPHQPPSANMKKCWNWFNAAEQRRDGGEASLIVGAALQTVKEFSADPARVYVAGLSAGGAAAAILATTYPDVFAAAGVHSGLACGAAKDMPSALAAMAGAAAAPPRAELVAPTIVFHGDADRIVNVVNADHVVAQARPASALTEVITEGCAPDGVSYTRTVQFDAAGKARLEQWLLHGAGHAWSGGSANGSYAEPRGPDASREMVRFFLSHANA